MKKLLAIVLAIACVLSFSGCDDDGSNSQSDSVTIFTTTTKQKTTATMKDNVSPVLYKDDNVTIKYTTSRLNEIDNIEVYFEIDNNSSKTLKFQSDAIVLNGYCFSDTIMSDEVPEKSTRTIRLSTWYYDPELIENVTSIGGQLKYFDDEYIINKTATLKSTKFDGSGNQELPSYSAEACLFSNDEISIYFKSAQERNYSENIADIKLFFANKTNRTISIQCDSIDIDSLSFSGANVEEKMMPQIILPQSMGIIDVGLKNVDFDLINIDNVKINGGQFKIIDNNGKVDTYTILF